MNEYEKELMQAPSIPPQPHCAIAWCGSTDCVEGHHVVFRSQGGEDGPTVPLCRRCHDRIHSAQEIELSYEHEMWWAHDVVSREKEPLRIFNAYADDPIPFDPDASLGQTGHEIRELVASGATVDYYLGSRLNDALIKFHGNRKELEEWIADNLDLSPKSIPSWLTKRLTYGKLPDTTEIHALGITKGYLVAKLSEEHDLWQIVTDIYSMPRSQFNAAYQLDKPRKARLCPHCGEEL